ncbi:MAG: DUF2278 family protein, partial [Capsulimonadales bacterium]|nr:DUF2278 family protein [Capsulimonadales bacterium]
MPLRQYGVLVGTVTETRPAIADNPHLQVKVTDRHTAYRVAINVRSKLRPSEVLYLVDERFSHPVLSALLPLAPGWHPLPSRPGSPAL